MEDHFYVLMREAMRRMYSGLTEAHQQYETDSRGGAIIALRTATQFVQSIADFNDRGLATPLVALLAGMHDLERGAIAPILRPTEARGRRPDHSLFDSVRGCIVFCVDAIIGTGSTPDIACETVARYLRHKGILKGHRHTTDATVLKGWREGKSRWKADSLAKSTYDALAGELAHVKFESPEHAWKCLEPMLEGLIEGFRSSLN